jgi:aubergine
MTSRNNLQEKEELYSVAMDIKPLGKKVFSNFFEIEVQQKVFMYKVDINPSPPNVQHVLRKIVREHVESVREKFGTNYMLLNSRLFSKNQGA